MPVYSPAPVTPVSGNGVWLYEADGTAWLDCVGGIAWNALGHCHPALMRALGEQAAKVWHVGNGFRIEAQEDLARRLTDAYFADYACFASTGTEAVECALKTVRRHHAVAGAAHRVDIVGFHGAFHGRTYGSLNAAGNPAYLDGFGPALPGFVQVDVDDVQVIEEAIRRPTTAGVIVEPVQGESGARALDGELRRLPSGIVPFDIFGQAPPLLRRSSRGC